MEDYIISPPQCRIQQGLQGCLPKPRAGCCASCQSVVCMEGLASLNGEVEQRAVPVQNPGHGAPNSCHQLPKVGQCQAFLRGAQWKDDGSYHKLQRKFWLDTGTKMFAVRLIKHWKSLPRKVVESQLLQIFKAQLDMALSNLLHLTILWTWGWTDDIQQSLLTYIILCFCESLPSVWDAHREMQLVIFIYLESISNQYLPKESPVSISSKRKRQELQFHSKLRTVVMPVPKSYMISAG